MTNIFLFATLSLMKTKKRKRKSSGLASVGIRPHTKAIIDKIAARDVRGLADVIDLAIAHYDEMLDAKRKAAQ